MKIISKMSFASRIWLIATFGFAVTIVIFFPGYRSPDSEWQLCQAVGRCEMNSWHPVSMALAWRLLLRVFGMNDGGLLVMQAMMFWTGLAVFAIGISRRLTPDKQWVSYLVPLIGFTPYILGILGVMWKDIQLASALILASSLIYLTSWAKAKEGRIFQICINAIIAVLLVYAVTLRVNAIAAVLPLVWMWAYGWKWLLNIGYRKITLSITLVLFTLVSVGCIGLLNKISGAKDESSTVTMFAYDIVNILPPEEIAHTSPASLRGYLVNLSNCSLYHNDHTDPILWRSQCAPSDPTMTSRKLNDYRGELVAYWKKTVMAHPARYVAQKVETYMQFLAPSGERSLWQNGIEGYLRNRGNYENGFIVYQSKKSIIGSYAVDIGYKTAPALYMGWFWLLVCLGVVVYGIKRLKELKVLVVCLSLSALMNILSYAPASVTADLRFIYWSMLAGTLAVMLAVSERYFRRTILRSRKKPGHIGPDYFSR